MPALLRNVIAFEVFVPSALMFFACASLGCLLPDTAWAQDELAFTREDVSLGSFIGNRPAASADFNGDGNVDLVIGTSVTFTLPPRILVLLGNGDGSFEQLPSMNIGLEPVSLVVADFNDDGRQDVVAPSAFGSAVPVLLGNGDGTFQPAPDINTVDVSVSAATSDFDGDGTHDLAISTFNNGESSVRVYLGIGDGTFSPGQEIVEASPRALTVGDFNGDGAQDLAAINFLFEENSVLILLGQGDGTFEPVSQRSAVGPEAYAITVGDFDDDGRQDVATADPNSDVVSVLMGNGDGTFDPAPDLQPGAQNCPGFLTQPMAIEVADFNGDGRQDLATGNRRPSDPPIESSASILLGRGDGTFEPAQEFETANGTTSLVIADFNNDGRPDLATSNQETSTVTILTAGSVNLAPASASSGGASSGSSSSGGGGGSFGLELWLLSALVLYRFRFLNCSIR